MPTPEHAFKGPELIKLNYNIKFDEHQNLLSKLWHLKL